jgi:hypothetical protein
LGFGSTWKRERERERERKKEREKKNQIKTVIRLIGDGCWLAKRWRVRRELGCRDRIESRREYTKE